MVWTLQRRGVNDLYPYHPCTVRYIYLFGIIWLFFNVLNMVFHVGKIYHSSHGMQNSAPWGISPPRNLMGLSTSSSIRLVDFPLLVDLTGVEEVENASIYDLKKASSVSTMASEAGTREGRGHPGGGVFFWPIWKSENVSVMRRSHSGDWKGEKEMMSVSTSNYQAALKFKIVTLKMMGVSTYLFSNMMKAEFYSVNWTSRYYTYQLWSWHLPSPKLTLKPSHILIKMRYRWSQHIFDNPFVKFPGPGSILPHVGSKSLGGNVKPD